MNYLKNEEEVDKLIEEMKSKTKTNYITQGVAFNKNCPRQMGLLKNALMNSASFSGLIKELLALKYSNESIEINNQNLLNNKKQKTIFNEVFPIIDVKNEEIPTAKNEFNDKKINQSIQKSDNTVNNNDLDDLDDLDGVDFFR